jgi:hypothetical protein
MTQRSLACLECGLYVQAATTSRRVTLKGATCNTLDPTAVWSKLKMAVQMTISRLRSFDTGFFRFCRDIQRAKHHSGRDECQSRIRQLEADSTQYISEGTCVSEDGNAEHGQDK